VNAQETFLEKHGGRRIVDYQCGGSFGVLLDGESSLPFTTRNANKESERVRRKVKWDETIVPGPSDSIRSIKRASVRSRFVLD